MTRAQDPAHFHCVARSAPERQFKFPIWSATKFDLISESAGLQAHLSVDPELPSDNNSIGKSQIKFTSVWPNPPNSIEILPNAMIRIWRSKGQGRTAVPAIISSSQFPAGYRPPSGKGGANEVAADQQT